MLQKFEFIKTDFEYNETPILKEIKPGNKNKTHLIQFTKENYEVSFF